jgi:hypothetical protein
MELISIVAVELPVKQNGHELWSLENSTKIMGTKQNHLAYNLKNYQVFPKTIINL